MATPINPGNIQGDILAGGLPKKTQTFLFFQITDGKKFVDDLAKLAPLIKTVEQILQDRDAIAKHKREKKPGLIKMVGVNISLSYTGLRAMGVSDDTINKSSLIVDGGIFKNGAVKDAKALGDPMLPVDPNNPNADPKPDWEQAFLGQIDGVILVAGDSRETVQEKIKEVNAIFSADPKKSSIKIVDTIVGDVRPGDEAGHEHFGFLDGVSNPLIAGFDTVVPGPSPVDASFILTGYNTQKATKDWTADGSFLVFRYLHQKVPEFNSFLEDNALKKHPITGADLPEEQGSELLGARLIGRWKSGAPVDVTPFQDIPLLAKDPQRINDFSFANEFRDNNKCPWAGHIRRTNPRADSTRLGANALDQRRIMRRGIAFGPEVTAEEQTSKTTKKERGLLFACYQANINTAFRFIQTAWANNSTFPFLNIPNVQQDPSPGFQPGVDPLLGQPTDGNKRQMTGYDPLRANDPSQKPLEMPVFIVPRGGGYFFTPPVKLLREFRTLVAA